jgi:hypothetical protein
MPVHVEHLEDVALCLERLAPELLLVICDDPLGISKGLLDFGLERAGGCQSDGQLRVGLAQAEVQFLSVMRERAAAAATSARASRNMPWLRLNSGSGMLRPMSNVFSFVASSR